MTRTPSLLLPLTFSLLLLSSTRQVDAALRTLSKEKELASRSLEDAANALTPWEEFLQSFRKPRNCTCFSCSLFKTTEDCNKYGDKCKWCDQDDACQDIQSNCTLSPTPAPQGSCPTSRESLCDELENLCGSAGNSRCCGGDAKLARECGNGFDVSGAVCSTSCGSQKNDDGCIGWHNVKYTDLPSSKKIIQCNFDAFEDPGGLFEEPMEKCTNVLSYLKDYNAECCDDNNCEMLQDQCEAIGLTYKESEACT